MIAILGVQFPVSSSILHPQKTEVVLAYTKAVKNGKKEAEKILKGYSLSKKGFKNKII